MKITKEILDSQYKAIRQEYDYLFHDVFCKKGYTDQQQKHFRLVEKQCHNFHRRYNKLFWKEFDNKCK